MTAFSKNWLKESDMSSPQEKVEFASKLNLLLSLFQNHWRHIIQTFLDVQSLKVPHSYYTFGHGTPSVQQLFAFGAVSDLVSSYVVYLITVTSNSRIPVAFVSVATTCCQMPPHTNVNNLFSFKN